ncbi:E2/UBC family protein [Mesorhizobium sp. WSM3876]|uniref:E2/UBC family protein n=1 Tax=Mesorhizobium sp. WSM3876 TaxID=422277 RepID=UPI001596865E|nr:E2/UBC family protein [Mesorhizobium sp. WSM3876]
MTPLDIQVQQLRERFGAADALPLAGGAILVTVPEVPLPVGWSKAASAIRFLAPAGYPFAALDCFWADPDLRLAGGGMPQNSAMNNIPETSEAGLWFSWHLTSGWNPNRDTLCSWMNTILDRLRRLQ